MVEVDVKLTNNGTIISMAHELENVQQACVCVCEQKSYRLKEVLKIESRITCTRFNWCIRIVRPIEWIASIIPSH